MRRLSPKRRPHKDETGYALLLIMFFLALLALSTVAVAPTVLSNIQREREKEMVWRGRQYVRGIRLYYMKMHQFPTSLDDLTTPKTGLRFMRKAYKDPTNGIDGTWRLIYVGPSGQLIGSLNNQALGTFGAMGAVPPAANMQQGSAFGGSASTFGSSFGSSFGSTGFGSSGSAGAASSATANQAGSQTAAGSGTGTPTDSNGQNGDSSDQMGTPQPLGVMDASNTIGGNIIGVGGKIKKKSFMWYQKAKDYQHFEFIWDPSKDMQIGAASQGIGTPIQGNSGTNPSGSGSFTSPFSSGPNPQQNQNPNPNPNQNANPGPESNPLPPLQAPPPSQ